MIGEEGVFCHTLSYLYTPSISTASVVYSHTFKVSGIKDRPVTYWYHMTLGYTQLLTGGIRVLLQAQAKDEKEDRYNLFQCLADKSCIEGKMVAKNQI